MPPTRTIKFTVTSVNDGPAPFDVMGLAEDGTELRLRFQTDHPGLAADASVSISYTPIPLPEPVEEPVVAPVDE